MAVTCEYFARCERETRLATSHPILGIVPICERCAEVVEIEPEYEIEQAQS